MATPRGDVGTANHASRDESRKFETPIALPEQPTISDEEDDDVFDLDPHTGDDTASIIGVSISQAQSRLKSPTTPAIEKLAAINDQGGFFEDRAAASGSQQPPRTNDVSIYREDGSPSGVRTPVKTSTSPSIMPSPWRAGPKTFQRNEDTSQLLGSVFRKRSSSGPERRLRLPLQLPSLPKPRLFGPSNDRSDETSPSEQPVSALTEDISRLDGSLWSRESWNDFVSRTRSQWSGSERPSQSDSSLTPVASPPTETSSHASQPPPRPERPNMGLRRTTSDQSLYLARTLSKASSLGDDTRFENVHEQINSRFKAIRDSWQDSNLRRNLPSLPKAISTSRVDLNEYSNGIRNSVVGARKPSSVPTRATQKSVVGISAANTPLHPSFTECLNGLTGDIVVLGGYRGSILRDAQPPHRRVWLPVLKAGLKFKRPDLGIGFEDEDEERITETVIPGGMLTHIGPVDISKRLLKRLRTCDNAKQGRLRVHEYGYDWRLSPDILSKQLMLFLEQLASNRPDAPALERGATVIAHSLGGLITRHAVNLRPDLFSGVVYAGVPNTCVNILGPLRFGDPVLFNSDVLTAQVNLSIRSSILLLPLNGRCFIDKETNEEYLVDFYNVDDWIKYRFSPCTDPPLPALNQTSKPPGIISTVTSIIPDSLASAMPAFMNRRDPNTARSSNAPSKNSSSDALASKAKVEHADAHAEGVPNAGMAPQMAQAGSSGRKQDMSNPATGVTIPRETAISYLRRVLPRIKAFREQLAHNSHIQEQNLYPPLAVMYGKTEPTVAGARVHGRDGIARTDAYSSLSFASGDGVVLSRAAQLPDGYRAARGGVVASERGHVTLLGDLEAVGRCLIALRKARLGGTGMGYTT